VGLVVALAMAQPARSATAAPPPLSRLHRAGAQIVDERGRVVLLRGVNVVWKAPPFVPPDAPGGLDDTDLDRIAAHGFDVIRLGVAFEGLMPTKGVVDHGYLDAVSATIDRIAAHGLYVLIDVHQDLMGQPWGNGFPPWAIHHSPELEALEPDLGFPLNAARPSHNLAWDFFWGDGKLAPGDPKGVVGYLTDAVGALTDRIGDRPGLAGVEILNEAWGGTPVASCLATTVVGCPVVDAYVQRTWQRLTDRIRQGAPDLLVWWEPASTWNLTVASDLADPPLTPAITDPNVAFAFHDYCAFGELSTYLGLPKDLQVTCDAFHDLTWQNAATFRARTGLPQLVTEFGNIDDAAELDRALRRSDAAFTGWQYWHYGNGGFGPRPASTEPFTPTQLSRLVRTYPVATAGTPGPLSFDPSTGEMHYRYTPSPAGGTTEIATSDVHYPHGYAATVTGGHLASEPGAARILVEPDAGAAQVEVTVRARAASAPADATPATTSAPATGRPHLPATGGAAPWWPWVALPAALALRWARRPRSIR
jgi:endoglycosylceramidase